MNKVFELIENDLKLYVTTPIDELHYDDIKSEYDAYTVSEFLMLYKLQRQFELNYISKKEYDDLKKLLGIKKQLLYELAKKKLSNMIDLISKVDSKSEDEAEINDISEKIHGINCVLNSYHLNQNLNLQNIIDSCIKNESYEYQDIEALKAFYMKTKKK